MAKISDLTDGGALRGTDQLVVARGEDNFRIPGSRVATVEDLAAVRPVVPVTPLGAPPTATALLPMMPNHVINSANGIDSFAFFPPNLNGSYVSAFYCDRNISVTALNLFFQVNENATDTTKRYRFTIQDFNPTTYVLGNHRYTGNPTPVPPTARLVVLSDRALSGVLEGGRWYIMTWSLEGATSYTGISVMPTFPIGTTFYHDGAYTGPMPSTGCGVILGNDHVTSGLAGKVITNVGVGALSMEWNYTTDAPRAFTGGSGFSA